MNTFAESTAEEERQSLRQIAPAATMAEERLQELRGEIAQADAAVAQAARARITYLEAHSEILARFIGHNVEEITVVQRADDELARLDLALSEARSRFSRVFADYAATKRALR